MDFIITEKNATICLNMIVKNEAHIIENTLEKLCNKIQFDYWVICDTGSTDDTPKIITAFFEKKGIKGELFFDEWVNFAHNRTLALQRAYKKTNLLLVFDADDEIVGDLKFPTEVLFDEYQFQFGSAVGISYTRALMINNYKKFEYLSVIHEFISCKEGPTKSVTLVGNYYVISGRTGNRSLDPDKYLKDALILEKAHGEALKTNNHLFHRYSFYCANSYKDCGKMEDAIKWYNITLGQEHQWAQEKYMSCLNIYECYQKLGEQEKGFFYLVKAFAYDTERVECLYPLLVHYCCANMNQVAYNYYLNIKDFYENRYLHTQMANKLFTIQDKYNFFVPYYMILIADKVQDFECVVKMYEIVFTKKQRMFEEWYVRNLLYNLQFFLQHVPKQNTNFVVLANEYIKFVYDNGVNLHNFDFLLKSEYKNAGLELDNYLITEVTNKTQKFSKDKCASSKNILIYTGFSDIEWNYTYIQNNAFGGSEKAVSYISQCFSQCFPKDYNIYISGQVKNETIGNIQYINLNELTNLFDIVPFHTVIVSRYVSFYEMFKECSFYQSFIWAHDVEIITFGSSLNETQLLKKWDKYINGCICLTEWHKNLFIERYPILKDKITLINNGLDLKSFPSNNSNNNTNTYTNSDNNTNTNNKNNKIKNKFIYSSRPERGLNILLGMWPQILEKIPDATLVVSLYVTFPSSAEDIILKNIIDANDSIKFLGKLNADQLYVEMASSEYWLYPTNWPETSCITALEMLMSEVICLYYPVAGLVDTMDKYGIPVQAGNEIDTLVSLTDVKKEILRKNGREYAETCSWSNRCEKWTELLSINQNIVVNEDKNENKINYKTIEYIDMNKKAIYFNNNNTPELVIVTCFLDINRKNWTNFQRTTTQYIESFINYFNYPAKMIIFIDDKYFDEFKKLYEKSSHNNSILIPINRQWMNEYIYAWQQLDKSSNIMNSEYYKNLVNARIQNGYPENIYPEYNAINHSKIDFICYAINNNLIKEDSFICWSDFGYFYSVLHNNPNKYPLFPIDIQKFNTNKLSFCLKNKLDDLDQDMIYTLLKAPEKFTGSFFAGPRNLMITLQELYHQSLNELYTNNISDDDQHIYLRCFLKEPRLFNLYLDSTKWPEGLIYFQKSDSENIENIINQLSKNIDNSSKTELCEIMNTNGSDKGSGWHNYTKLYYELFKDKRNDELNIFELGLGTNNINIPSNMGASGKPCASVYGWKQFFKNSKIFGADIDKNILIYNEDIKTYYCDQLSKETINNMYNNFDLQNTYFDIIIEDGLHNFEAHMSFMRNSLHKLNPNGVYIIENIDRSYKDKFTYNLCYTLINKYDLKYIKLIELPNQKNPYDNNLLIIQKNNTTYKIENISNYDHKPLFLVTSLINLKKDTVYSSEERLLQTIKTIKSIYNYCPNAIVVILEASNYKYSDELIDLFKNLYIYYITTNVTEIHKSIGESIIIKEFISTDLYNSLINTNKINIVFKISGRYLLNEHFKITNFNLDKHNFRFINTFTDDNLADNNKNYNSIDMCCVTCLFAFNPNNNKEILDSLNYVIENVVKNGYDIEHQIYMYFHNKDCYNLIENLGISGFISPTGQFINY